MADLTLFNWFAGVDIGIRPRQVFDGADINLFPFTNTGLEWLQCNIQNFTDPIWSPEERCLRLSRIDSVTNVPNVIRALQNGGLKLKFYGRLADLNRAPTDRDSRASVFPSNMPRAIVVSATIQMVLFAEPMWRAIKLGSVSSIVGTSLLITMSMFFVLKATICRKTWARDGLAQLAVLGFVWAIVSGYLFEIDHPEVLLAAATSIPNLIAVAMLYMPSSDQWFDKDNKGVGPR